MHISPSLLSEQFADDFLPLNLSLDNEFKGSASKYKQTEKLGTFRKINTAVKMAVFQRDDFCCRFCGFRSEKYQYLLIEGQNNRDVDSLYTVCIFCHQCFDLKQVAKMRSGVLIWLPEISQTELHHVARDIYRARIMQGLDANNARLILDCLIKLETANDLPVEKSSRQLILDFVGTDDPALLTKKLREKQENGVDINRLTKGIRLFPLDRRIVQEEGLEYNQFPQILAYWRSKQGSLPKQVGFSWLSYISEKLKLGLNHFNNTEQKNDNSKPHTELAAKLLRDAANFFQTLGEQNLTLEKQMQENTAVFLQIASLVEKDPDQKLQNSNDTVAIMAGKLLKDASNYFFTLSKENESLREQMLENANVYNQMGEHIINDPHGRLT